MIEPASPLEDPIVLSYTAPVTQPLKITLFLVLALLPIWYALGAVPINPRSEGRYAAISRDLADRQEWLVPMYGDKPHLTKPPLTYWTQAATIRVLGPTPFAVRVPSAVAGSLVVAGLLALGWFLGGPRLGMLAAGLVAVMPLPVIISRLTLTDGLLAPCWLGVLAGGYLAIARPRHWAGPVLLWSAVALGLLTKGPIILMPLLILLLWVALAGRWAMLRHWRAPLGLPLALVPVLLWGLLMVLYVPDAVDIWRDELRGPLSGQGSHPEPWWYFLAVLLAGAFPATAMLSLPGLNVPLQRVRALIRHGDHRVLWSLAVIVPLVLLSIPQGKLATYILPATAPLALLAALGVERWLRGRNDPPRPGHRPPDVRWTLLGIALLLSVVAPVALTIALGPGAFWLAWPMGLCLAAAIYLARIWSSQPARRWTGLALGWLAMVIAAMWIWTVTAAITQPFSAQALLAQIEPAGQHDLAIGTYRFGDNALSFYHGRFVPRLNDSETLDAFMADHAQTSVIITRARDWERLIEEAPAWAERLHVQFTFAMQFDEQPLLILRPLPADQ